jgi:peptide-methionine (S)-S-oxide reductase
MIAKNEIITLGGGCFWCLEAVYDDLEGVLDVVSGYAGGHIPNPEYASVCNETSGHAEVVQVTFDPQVVSLKEILEIFFSIHDPTTLNRQGADVGAQYRSAIFYNSEAQKAITEQVITEFEAEKIWPNPIITEVQEFEEFFPAEDYHQEYYKRNPYQGYCQIVIAPKVAKFRKKYANRLKSWTAP